MQAEQRDSAPTHEMTLAHLLGRSSEELASSVRACTELQWVISRLLEKSDHPDLVTEMHVLQDIDRLQQTLADLACLLETVAIEGAEHAIDASTALGAMRLPSLRHRMFGGLEPSAGQGGEEEEASDITWL